LNKNKSLQNVFIDGWIYSSLTPVVEIVTISPGAFTVRRDTSPFFDIFVSPSCCAPTLSPDLSRLAHAQGFPHRHSAGSLISVNAAKHPYVFFDAFDEPPRGAGVHASRETRCYLFTVEGEPVLAQGGD
jgi:hypothetical protein